MAPDETVQLELSVLLPDVPDSEDSCVERFSARLQDSDGVERVHVEPAGDATPVRLCIHYDRSKLGLDDVRRIARQTGAQLTDQVGHLLWGVEGLGYARRARTVGERLRRLDGVLEAEASSAGVVRVEYDRSRIEPERIEEVLRELDVVLAPRGSGEEEHHDCCTREREGVFGERTEMIFALGAGAAYLTGLLLGWLTDLPEGASIAAYVVAYALGGWFTVREAFDSLRAGRFEVDFLMVVAALGAAALGKWAEGAVLLFLFSLGHALEHYAMGRARRAIEALAELAPKTALVRRDGVEAEMPVESIVVGDVVIVRPNGRLPADGFVVEGETSVDQAPVTGESIPVDKRPVADPDAALADPDAVTPESRVFAGTINGAGAIEIVVTRRNDESTLARVVELVAEAETQRSPTQRFTDRFERVFVPSVLTLVGLLLLAPLALDEPFGDSFYRAMAVLVAASPCALAISTPSAVLSGVARAARSGVLVKGGGPLENLGGLSALAFDKTGTLTEGKPRVTDVVPAGGVGEVELLSAAVAIERLSDHPLAAAVVRDGQQRLGKGAPIEEAEGLEAITGRGVKAVLGGEPAHLGSLAMFEELGGAEPPGDVRETVARLAGEGRTTMVLRRGERYLGVLGLMDTPRERARELIRDLHALGIKRTILLSGDNQRVAEAIGREVGVDEVWGDLMPEDKVDAIKELSDEEGRCAMVGDGVNDAPAMANATVGIAMGAAGSDVALETADVALMADDLAKLPFATGLSRGTSRIIKQNLFISLGIVGLLVPATILGLGIGPAVLVHEGSTLIVVFNALRLLGYRE